jgi:hypothetical protein
MKIESEMIAEEIRVKYLQRHPRDVGDVAYILEVKQEDTTGRRAKQCQ